MLKLCVLAVFAPLFLFGCLEGPEGPSGQDGDDGKDGQSVVLTSWNGILYPADEKKEPGAAGYWDISNSAIRDDRLVAVYVRQGAGFMWTQPTWLLSNGYVRIGNDDKADPSWEYKITVGR